MITLPHTHAHGVCPPFTLVSAEWTRFVPAAFDPEIPDGPDSTAIPDPSVTVIIPSDGDTRRAGHGFVPLRFAKLGRSVICVDLCRRRRRISRPTDADTRGGGGRGMDFGKPLNRLP